MDTEHDLMELSDGELLTNDGWKFQIHKIILARSSEYFCTLFCGISQDISKFTISGVSGESLRDVLNYIYTGNIRVTEQNVADLLITADCLLLKDLYLKVKDSLTSNMTDVSCLKILKAANDIKDKEIYKDSFRFTQIRFEWIMRCARNGVADLPFEILETILRNGSLYVFSEMAVWLAIVEWTQNDLPHRLGYVPRLLLSLAIAEVGEELAAEILRHEIITRNDALLEYLNGVKTSNYFTNNLQIFSNLLCNHLSYISKPYYHRIPKYIHIVYHHGNFYVTYDENIDLWTNIPESDLPPDFLTLIRHNIEHNIDITFELNLHFVCKNFDLIRMGWVPSELYRKRIDQCILTIDQCIYVLGPNCKKSYHMMLYDTELHRWLHGRSLKEIPSGRAVSIDKKIYVVGNDQNFVTNMMYVFDPVSNQWSLLSSPNLNHVKFALVEYHQKVYLIGGTLDEDIDKVEVYDPETNIWKELPDIPHSYDSVCARVLNDQILIYELTLEKCHKIFRWALDEERWEQLEEVSLLQDFLLHSPFCTIHHAETINLMTRRNRDPNVALQKSPVKLNN